MSVPSYTVVAYRASVGALHCPNHRPRNGRAIFASDPAWQSVRNQPCVACTAEHHAAERHLDPEDSVPTLWSVACDEVG